MRITWHLPAMLSCLTLTGLVAWNWSWMTSRPPRVVRFSGTHREIGLAHGSLLRHEIEGFYRGYVLDGLVAREGWPESELLAVGRHYDEFLPAECREEMRGIAQGAGVPYERILVMNTLFDALLGKSARACSGLAVLSREGMIAGHNVDWIDHGIAHRHGVVFALAPEGRHRIMSVGWPGMVGVVTGMNDEGLVVCMNMASAGDLDTDATPALIRIRHTLENENGVGRAVRALAADPRTIAMNLLIADERSAVSLELSGRQHAIVPMRDGCVANANYYQALAIRGGSGADRVATMIRAIDAAAELPAPRDIRSALRRVHFFDWSGGMATIQSVVLRPRDLAADVAIGQIPATSGRYYVVRMDR
ncbi:MAG: hypothetical protein HYX75_25800 [Acidobacteria bacterium]|nr:hypothetical protein [Acidobacteriota bacterium]